MMMMIDLYTTLSGILVLQTEEKMRCRIFRVPSQKAFFIRKRRKFQKLLARCVSKKTVSDFCYFAFILSYDNLKLKMDFLS